MTVREVECKEIDEGSEMRVAECEKSDEGS